MSPSMFPSINSLLNSGASTCPQLPSNIETRPRQEERPPSAAISFMSMSTADQPTIQDMTGRDAFASGSSATSSPVSVLTIITPESPNTAQCSLPPPSEISIDDPWVSSQRRPSCSFAGLSSGIFPLSRGSTYGSAFSLDGNRGSRFSAATPRSDSAFIDSLLRICVTCALRFYHSLLPRPAVSVSVRVQHTHPQSRAKCGDLQSSTITEYHPHPSPETAWLCAEALSAISDARAKLSLPGLLDLISHATRGGDEACQTQPLALQGHHAAQMAQLWGLATQLLGARSRAAQGIRLGPHDLLFASRTAMEFCKQLRDEEGMQDVDFAWSRLRSG